MKRVDIQVCSTILSQAKRREEFANALTLAGGEIDYTSFSTNDDITSLAVIAHPDNVSEIETIADEWNRLANESFRV